MDHPIIYSCTITGNLPGNWPKLLGPFQNVLPPLLCSERLSTSLLVQRSHIFFFSSWVLEQFNAVEST